MLAHLGAGRRERPRPDRARRRHPVFVNPARLTSIATLLAVAV
jgi:hypothetical protein